MSDAKNELDMCREDLAKILQDPKESLLERRVAGFYLDKLKPYTAKFLHRQDGFHQHIGGTGDNIVNMPVIERDDHGPVVDETGDLKITYCVFDDFQGYLRFIKKRSGVRYIASHCRHFPPCLNGVSVADYQAIWNRSQGLERDDY